MRSPKPIRVGITIAHCQDVPSVLWSNGIYQNIVYLMLLLQQIKNIEPALICYPFGDMPLHPVGACFGFKTINDAERAREYDVIIELGIRLERDFTQPYRARGGKLVSYMAGNAMVMNFESVFLEPGAAARGSMLSPDGFDAVRITPQHMHMNAGASAMTGGPVEEAPHIWAPACLEHARKSLGLNPTWKGRPETWSLATFDPNINVVKSFHIPLLVAEAAYRRDPSQIRRMMLFCSEQLKGRPHFESHVANLEIGRAGKVTAEGRHGIVAMLGREVDCVITHQWENDLNYLYWDTLYLGYPLVHNSKRFEGGYRYPDFDPMSGGGALLEAIGGHEADRERDTETVWQFHINNPANQDGYATLVKKVFDSPKASL